MGGGIEIVGSDVEAFVYLITSDLLSSNLDSLYYINDYSEIICNEKESLDIDGWSSLERGVY